jgi:hypothetical protein
MGITITNRDVVQALPAIQDLMATRKNELGPVPTYWLGRALGILARHDADALAPVRQSLIDKHALKDEKGAVVSNELGRIQWKSPEDSAAFDAGYSPVLDLEWEFPLNIWLEIFGDFQGLGFATQVMQPKPAEPK